MNIKFELYRIYNLFVKKKLKYSDSDYISGNCFMKICNKKFKAMDHNDKFFRSISSGDIIYVDFKDLNLFLNFAKNIKDKKFGVLIHNLDGNSVNQSLVSSIPENIYIFSQNLNIENIGKKNLHLIPTGLHNENEIFYRKGVDKYIESLTNVNKLPAILCNFNYTTNPKRRLIVKEVMNLETIHYKNFLVHKNYLGLLNNYMFVLCPEGTNLDTHRFWEVLATGSIPIVRKSNIYEFFKNLDIPMLVIDEWKDLRKLSAVDLKKIYHNLQVKNAVKFLKIDFWNNYIKCILNEN